MTTDPSQNYCAAGGVLVDVDGFLPESIYEYNWGSFDPRIGCNRLACSSCGAAVRHQAGISIPADTAVNSADLYAAQSWGDLAYLRTEPGQRGRLYACRCLAHVQFGSTELESPFPEQELLFFLSRWGCAGHPKFTLPGEALGVIIDSSTDIRALVRAALAGDLPKPNPPRLARVPGYSASRLYMLLRDAGLGAEVGRSVAGYLADPDPILRRAALELFFDHPSAEGAEQIAIAAQHHRDLFEGHPDPNNARYDLHHHLLRALEQRVSSVGDRAAIEAAQRELLRGTRRRSLIQTIAGVDAQWAIENAGDIVQANPGILKEWLYGVNKLPSADIAIALKAAIARGLVTPEDVVATLNAVFRSEPARGEEIARALGRP